MAFEHKEGQGTLYKARQKRSDKAPDWEGPVVAHRDIKAGEELRLAGWAKTPTMLSLKLSDARPKTEPQPERYVAGKQPPLDDEIPF